MPRAQEDRTGEPQELQCASSWLALAVGVLVLAGLFSLIVVIGRMPPFDRFVSDPLFFKRGLVVHVNFALVAWFYSFVAAMLFLVLADDLVVLFLGWEAVGVASALLVAFWYGEDFNARAGAKAFLVNRIGSLGLLVALLLLFWSLADSGVPGIGSPASFVWKTRSRVPSGEA